jgi:hypothetical protein
MEGQPFGKHTFHSLPHVEIVTCLACAGQIKLLEQRGPLAASPHFLCLYCLAIVFRVASQTNTAIERLNDLKCNQDECGDEKPVDEVKH